MATTAAQIITDVRRLLVDENAASYRWSLAELETWLHEAQTAVVTLDPVGVAVAEVVPTVAGCRQTVPAGTHMLIDVVEITAPIQRAVRLVMAETFKRVRPNYQNDTAGVPRNWFRDDPAEGVFYLYPAPQAGTMVRLRLAKTPAPVTGGANISVPDRYRAALVNYICYRAVLKDADYAGEGGLAAYYAQQFGSAMGSDAAISALAAGQRAATARGS